MNYPQEYPISNGATLIIPETYQQTGSSTSVDEGAFRVGVRDNRVNNQVVATEIHIATYRIVMAASRIAVGLQNIGLTAVTSANDLTPLVFTDAPENWAVARACGVSVLTAKHLGRQEYRRGRFLLVLDQLVETGKISAEAIKALGDNPDVITLLLVKNPQSAASLMAKIPQFVEKTWHESGTKHTTKKHFFTTLYGQGAQHLADTYGLSRPPASLNAGQFAHRFMSNWETTTAIAYHALQEGEIHNVRN